MSVFNLRITLLTLLLIVIRFFSFCCWLRKVLSCYHLQLARWGNKLSHVPWIEVLGIVVGQGLDVQIKSFDRFEICEWFQIGYRGKYLSIVGWQALSLSGIFYGWLFLYFNFKLWEFIDQGIEYREEILPLFIWLLIYLMDRSNQKFDMDYLRNVHFFVIYCFKIFGECLSQFLWRNAELRLCIENHSILLQG